MSEENKTYEIIGTVTISTEEYRELIERALRSELDMEKGRDEWWKERCRADKAEKELAEITEKHNAIKKFIQSDADTYAMYMVWKTERGDME